MAQRMLICAGLARGESTAAPVAESADVTAAADCLRALGASVRFENGRAVIRGTDPARAEGAVLRCGDSAAALRFFIPLCLLSEREMRLEGSAGLMNRPLAVYRELFRERGLLFAEENGGVRVKGRLEAGEYELDGAVSSQFVSGLLFALPGLPGDSVLRLRPPVESRSYIDMTMAALGAFGVETRWLDRETIAVPGRQCYEFRSDVTVEGDWSNAAFFLALGLDVTGLDPESLQGDRVCAAHFAALRRGPAAIDIADCPDLGPVLFAFAAAHRGGVFTGTRRLRMKESDRGAAMAEELRKFGVTVDVEENRVTVSGGIKAPTETLSGHNDHRVVMALAVLLTRVGGSIAGAEAVSKSFPDFFARLQDCNIEMEIR